MGKYPSALLHSNSDIKRSLIQFPAYSLTVCYEDWLEMYVLYRDGTDRFLGRYCGLTAPGPVESPRGAVGIRVLLHTDQENVASGFKARYIFEVAKSVFGDCGGNYTGLDSGVITSPNFPSNYEGPGKGLASRACNWYITARIGYKILLNFEHFAVEGDPAGELQLRIPNFHLEN